MTTQFVPTQQNVAFYTQRTRLDGIEYLLSFSFNEREQQTGRWYLSISDTSGNLIVGSIKLIANWPLLRHYHWNTLVPPGELLVIDATGDGSPPGIDELGDGLRCHLIYRPASG